MTYQVVFDAAEHGYHTWWFTLPGAFAIAGAGVVLAIARRRMSARDRRAAPVFAIIVTVAGLASIISVYDSTHHEYLVLMDGLRSNHFETVEGRVTDFVPRGDGGHPSEHWSVRGHRYVISPATVTSAFNTPGIVRSGDSVRIADIDGSIARLEVMR
jgi:hypothetical protein